MVYFLFVLYALLIGYFLPKIPFIQKSGLRPNTIRVLFAIKVLVCIAWGYINIHHLRGISDPVALNELASMEHEFLKSDPEGFLKDLFISPYGHYGNFFGSINSYWNDLDINIMAKTIALFNFITLGNYYINALLGIVFSFFGCIALVRLYTSIYTNSQFPIIVGAFLIPSLLLFTGSNCKDNVCYTLLALFSLEFYRGLKERFTFRKMALLGLIFVGLLLIRNHLALLMIPALFIWYVGHHRKISPLKMSLVTYGTLAILLAIISILNPAASPANIIAKKQRAFLAIPEANSQLPIDTLNGSLTQIIYQAPQAINHGFFRPYIWESKNSFHVLLSAEVLAILFLIAVVVSQKRKSWHTVSPLVVYGASIAVSMIILTGYITPNFNTIARYKCIMLPFLLIPFLVHFSYWPKALLRIRF